MKKFLGLWLLAAMACTTQQDALVEYVNPFIGTGGHGHTYPGATMPFGMVQLSPDSRLTGWDGCGGYHYSDSLIYGFSHTHLQGTGISDYGDILFMPTNNAVHKGNNWGERYRSEFSHASESAHAGYYKVHLDDHNLTAELTATTRVGIHKYVFDTPDSCVLFIDMAHRDPILSYQFEPVGDTMIVGMRQSKEWAENQVIYFAAVFDKPFEYLDQTYEYSFEEDINTGEKTTIMNLVPVFPLKFGKIASLQAKVALSSTSYDAAIQNLQSEAPHWNFETYRNNAEEAWNNALGKVNVVSDNTAEKTKFYTALYHSLTVPNMWSDASGTYMGMDRAIHSTTSNQYTVFSLWDTFRAAHPLYTLIERKRTEEFIQSFLNMYQQGGKLPMWELAANYTGCMIGYHAVPVIVDAHFKGIDNFDKQLALEAMVSTAAANELGKHEYMKWGYIPLDLEHESVSKTLEYAYNDWCIARFAEDIGNAEVAATFYERALFYRNLYDSQTGFLRQKRGATFTDSFDPTEVNFNYTEANCWQYNFFVPQDVNGHIDLMGGSAQYERKLDSLFFGSSEMGGRVQPDITGLIGQYAHGNEPSHHMAYLYNFIGRPSQTGLLVDSIMTHLYTNAPDGLSGNEDCGQMSAWYVLSALGFYPVTPGSDEWILGTPRFESVSIHLENGKTFAVNTKDFKPGNKYVIGVELNGKPYHKGFIRQADLLAGGELTFIMSDAPNDAWMQEFPVSRTDDRNFIIVPTIECPRTFRDSALLVIRQPQIDSGDEQLQIMWRQIETSGVQGDLVPFQLYTGPLYIRESGSIEAYVKRGNAIGKLVHSEVKRIDHTYTITIETPFDNQYTAGGTLALIDGIEGGNNFKTGEWQGYYGKDVVFTVDLGVLTNVKELHLGALQEIRPWIWFPELVTFSVSKDGEVFKDVGSMESPVPAEDERALRGQFSAYDVGECRFVKIIAKNRGNCPDWHLGAGYPSWMFFDELNVVKR